MIDMSSGSSSMISTIEHELSLLEKSLSWEMILESPVAVMRLAMKNLKRVSLSSMAYEESNKLFPRV
jgi:hypothetical protein